MIAVLHAPDFALQVLCRLDPRLGEGPLALIEKTATGDVVTQCNAAAASTGVLPGQASPQALARCPGLRFVAPSPAAEAEADAVLQAIALTLTPQIEQTAPGICTLGFSGVPIEKRETGLHEALASLETQGLVAAAGLAPTPWLALCAARVAGAEARVRSVDDGRAFLDALPVETAEPPTSVLTVLRGWGVRTLGDLARLPKAEIARRLGADGVAAWERAAGETARPLRLLVPALRFEAAHEFEQEIETLPQLLFVLRRFVDRFALELAAAGLAAGELLLTLSLADETHGSHVLRLPEPSTRADILFRCLATRLESLHTEAAVVALKLAVTPVRAREGQHGFFDHGLSDPHVFADTLARANAIVGVGRLGTPVPADTHRPDTFVLVDPPVDIASLARGGADRGGRGPALRRFRPPRPATVELVQNTPQFLWSGAVRASVRAVSGPWRSSGDWWEEARLWQRQEWDVELEGGGLYRLLHTPQGWFLEGEYD